MVALLVRIEASEQRLEVAQLAAVVPYGLEGPVAQAGAG
jgi:hypothetical protein